MPHLKKSQKGFTLFEIQVALILLGIMIAGATFAYIHFMDEWDEDYSRLEMQRQGLSALAVMGKIIKQATADDDGTFAVSITSDGGGTDNRIRVIVPAPDGSTEAVEYYQDDNRDFHPLIQKKGAEEIVLIPEAFQEHGVSESHFLVDRITFSNETTASSGTSVRMDLELELRDHSQSLSLTASVRLRNEDIH